MLYESPNLARFRGSRIGALQKHRDLGDDYAIKPQINDQL